VYVLPLKTKDGSREQGLPIGEKDEVARRTIRPDIVAFRRSSVVGAGRQLCERLTDGIG
jgi:hypothetical protein